MRLFVFVIWCIWRCHCVVPVRTDRMPNGVTVYSLRCGAEAAGMILTDSIARCGPPSYVNILPVVLQRIYASTGYSLIGVYAGGAGICPYRSEKSYMKLLKLALRYMGVDRVKYILCVSGGNDLYYPAWRGEYPAALNGGALALGLALREAAEFSMVVLGGGSGLWGYDTHGDWDSSLYDSFVLRCLAMFVYGVDAVRSGCVELRGIRVCDRIGHVHEDSQDMLTTAFVEWVLLLMRVRLSRL